MTDKFRQAADNENFPYGEVTTPFIMVKSGRVTWAGRKADKIAMLNERGSKIPAVWRSSVLAPCLPGSGTPRQQTAISIGLDPFIIGIDHMDSGISTDSGNDGKQPGRFGQRHTREARPTPGGTGPFAGQRYLYPLVRATERPALLPPAR
jgi:hypothetical protein